MASWVHLLSTSEKPLSCGLSTELQEFLDTKKSRSNDVVAGSVVLLESIWQAKKPAPALLVFS